MGVPPPPAHPSLIVIELGIKGEWKVGDVLNPTLPNVRTLGGPHVDVPGEVEQKCYLNPRPCGEGLMHPHEFF